MLNTEKLIRLRKIKKLSQEQLAQMVGITKPTYNSIEKGGDVKLSTIENISTALGVSFLYWFKEPDNEGNRAEEPEDISYTPQSTQVMLRQILTNTEKLLDKKKIGQTQSSFQ